MPRTHRNRRLLLIPAAAVCLCVATLLPAGFAAEPQVQPAGTPDPALWEAARDSLSQEIKRYSEMIRVLRDSLDGHDRSALDDRLLGDVEDAIVSLSEAVSSITEQLSSVQFEIDEGRFSLRDGSGGRVSVQLPPDLEERLSQGLASITRVILEEIPDTLRAGDQQTRFSRRWNGLFLDQTPPPEREHVILGDVFKFNDDLQIDANEVVRGDAVVLFGNAVIRGRIEGNLVVAFGDIELQQDAAVDGTVAHVLGRFQRHEGAQTGRTTVRLIDLSEGLLLFGRDRQAAAWPSFLAFQGLFVLVLCLVILVLAVLPRSRLDAVAATLNERPVASVLLGQLLASFGHAAVIGLNALLVLTVIGIPIALLAMLALALLDLAALGVASLSLGRYVAARLGYDCRQPWKAALLGLVILHVPAFLAAFSAAIGMSPVLVSLLTWTGRVCKFLALGMGLGAMLLGRFGSPGRSRPPIDADRQASGLAV